MPRPLPTPAEAAEILARKRTRPQRRPPPVAGRGLSKLLKELDAKYGQGPGALQARWREIVGVELAKRTEPVKLTKPRGGGPGALEIRVAGASAALIQHQAHEIHDRREAIKFAVAQAKSGDIVVIAGKGHENYQEIDGVRHWFDDAVEVQSAIDAQHHSTDSAYPAH